MNGATHLHRRVSLVASAALLLATGLAAAGERDGERSVPPEWAVVIPDASDEDYGKCPPGVTCVPENGTFPARAMELTLATVSHLAWNARADDELSFRWGLGVEYVPWLLQDEQAPRLGVFQTITLGGWGDDDHRPVTFETGVKLRVSFLEARQLIDVYPVFGTGFLYSPGKDVRWGFRPTVGLGVRIFRAFSAEIGADLLLDPDCGFEQSARRRDPWIAGASTLVGLDTCALGDWCDHAPYTQQQDNLTCCMEDDAGAACEQAGSGGARAREQLCAHMTEAMDTPELCRLLRPGPAAQRLEVCGETVEAPSLEACVDDPVGASLLYLVRELGPSHPSTTSLCRARHHHDARLAWRKNGRDQERQLSQRGRALARRRVYAPFVSDLRVALGCAAPADLRTGAEVAAGAPAAPAPRCVQKACKGIERLRCGQVKGIDSRPAPAH